jgi:hypothetical protein
MLEGWDRGRPVRAVQIVDSPQVRGYAFSDFENPFDADHKISDNACL